MRVIKMYEVDAPLTPVLAMLLSTRLTNHLFLNSRRALYRLTLSVPLFLSGCGAPTSDGDEPQNSGGGATGTGGKGQIDPGSGGTGGTDTGPVTTEDGLELDGSPEYFRVVRLTHHQWENAVRDLLELNDNPGLSGSFIPDPPEGTFSNNERALYVTDGLRLDYQRSAEDLAEQVAGGGMLQRWGSSADEVVRNLGRRAFRRSLEQEEADRYIELWQSGAEFYASGDDFADGMRVFLEALLQSPHFLYRLELSPAGERLSGTELATRLSFLLENTAPSAELLAAAEAGELDDDAGLLSQAESMLEEDGAKTTAELLHDELFGLSRYRSILKSPDAFPEYSEDLNQVLYEADTLFFSNLFETGGGLRDILTSQIAYANDAVAKYYGITVTGSQLQQVELDETRPGFLTRIGFLAYNANLSQPDPIHRGVEINARLLCAELSPPPGEIPPLPSPQPGQTNRERVEAHTGSGVCGNCHQAIINPPGFALEGFDAMGQARTTDNGKPIDTSGAHELLGSQPFDGIVDMAQLLADSSRVHACYSAHIAEYALSRDLSGDDVELLESLSNVSVSADASIKDLLLATVTSPRFTHIATP